MMNRAKIGRKSRRKGYSGEHKLVLLLRENGIEVKRTAHPGLPGDLTLITGEKIEVKNRENISQSLWDWQTDVTYVALKKNNEEYLIQMKIDDFINLYKSLPSNNSLSNKEIEILGVIRKMNA